MTGIYIHIPFCRRKCPYCDFFSVCSGEEQWEQYTQTICQRIVQAASVYPTKADTLYFGGGTPGLIGAQRLCRMVRCVRDHFGLQQAEVTVEVNPEKRDIDFAALKQGGVNRISIGLQSAHDDELRQLGRLHRTEDAVHCIRSAREAGFENISLDLMLAIPLQTKERLLRSIDFCARQQATHISAYLLKIEPDTPYAQRRDKALLCDDDRQAELYLTAVQALHEYGYEQYEISNFAKSGYQGQHNLKYWHDEEYLGFGPSAHSFMNGRRFYCGRSFESFWQNSITDDGAGGDEEEFLMLGLRLTEGVTNERFRRRFGKDIPREVFSRAEKLQDTGLLQVSEDHIALTPRGFLLSNAVIGRLVI